MLTNRLAGITGRVNAVWAGREVRTALTRDEFRPAKRDALRNTLDWVQSEPEKIAKLPWLLDAVMALVESGTQVVLRTTSAEAAHWIRLTSWLLDAEAAALLNFQRMKMPDP